MACLWFAYFVVCIKIACFIYWLIHIACTNTTFGLFTQVHQPIYASSMWNTSACRHAYKATTQSNKHHIAALPTQKGLTTLWTLQYIQDQLCAYVLWSENLSRQLPKWIESPLAIENEAFSVSAYYQTLPRTHFRCPDQLEGNIVCLLYSLKSVEKYAWGHNVSKSADLQLLTLESEMHESVWGCSFRHNSEYSLNVIGLKWAHSDKQQRYILIFY